MPQYPVSDNPSIYSTDTATFFRGFVAGQDEVSKHWGPDGKEKKSGIFWIQAPPDLIQVQVSDSNLRCKSVFSGHALQPKTNAPLKLDVAQPDWIFGLLLICTALLLFAKLSYDRRMGQIFGAFLRQRQLLLLIREGNILSERITPPLIILHMLSFSLFFFLLIDAELGRPDFLQNEYLLFLLILGCYAFFFGLRLFIIFTLGWIFASKETTQTYIVNSLIIDEVCGMFLIPVCLMVFYAPHPAGHYTMLTAAVLFAVLLLYKLTRNFMVGISNPNFSWLYLFLYLCTVEILPVLFLGKMASAWLSN
jgi:hypothetical protein